MKLKYKTKFLVEHWSPELMLGLTTYSCASLKEARQKIKEIEFLHRQDTIYLSLQLGKYIYMEDKWKRVPMDYQMPLATPKRKKTR